MYAGRVSCCFLVSHAECTARPIGVRKNASSRYIKVRGKCGTDGRTPDRYITLTAIDAASVPIYISAQLFNYMGLQYSKLPKGRKPYRAGQQTNRKEVCQRGEENKEGHLRIYVQT